MELQFTSEVIAQLSEAIEQRLAKGGVMATKSEVNALAAEMAKTVKERLASGNPAKREHSKAVRALLAIAGKTLVEATKESDINYLQHIKQESRALVTGSTPGSYLVPTIQAGETIPALTLGGVLRAAGARIWSMVGVQKENIPAASGLPTVEYLAQTAAQTPADINLAQVAMDLKERRALSAIPRRLLITSSPAVDVLVEELMGEAFAEGEDNAFFSTATVSGGPTSVYAASGTTTFLVGGSANGGNLAYADLLGAIRRAIANKAKGGFVWMMSPRTFFDRIVGMVDSTGQPVFQKDPAGKILGTVLGYPVFISPFVPENQANGSGTNQSYLIFTNPRYLHIGDSGQVEIALSEERYFDLNQVAIRGVHAHDFGYAPSAGIVILKGIN